MKLGHKVEALNASGSHLTTWNVFELAELGEGPELETIEFGDTQAVGGIAEFMKDPKLETIADIEIESARTAEETFADFTPIEIDMETL